MLTESRRRRAKAEHNARETRRATVYIAMALLAYVVLAVVLISSKPAVSLGSDAYKPSTEVIGVPYDEDTTPPKKVRLHMWEKYSCSFLRDYLLTHTEEQAREEAKRLHFPQWLIHRAEKCPR